MPCAQIPDARRCSPPQALPSVPKRQGVAGPAERLSTPGPFGAEKPYGLGSFGRLAVEGSEEGALYVKKICGVWLFQVGSKLATLQHSLRAKAALLRAFGSWVGK